MFLTRQAILESVHRGEIVIHPFKEQFLSPNSVDVTLNSKLLVYDLESNSCLDMKKDNPVKSITIPKEGFVLQPGILYIGSTNETATSHRYIPMFEGRSSVGRLGINTHITAGFGDVGWGFKKDNEGNLICMYPTWTLEISVVHPIRIYADIRIGQVYFVMPKGDISFYDGKYSSQKSPQASRMWMDFKNEETSE